MNEYTPIHTLVESSGMCRIFTTRSFTIRALVVALQRYNPDSKIVAISKNIDDFQATGADSRGWSPSVEEIIYGLSHPEHYFPRHNAEYLKNNSYRDAMNMWYFCCQHSGIYPVKKPFSGTQTYWPAEHNINIGRFGTFIRHEENPYKDPSNILLDYDGRFIRRTINGEEVEGYLLTAARYINNAQKQA